MITILAEKPSVARDIAANVGATNKADGYLYGNGYSVTWAFGHLVQLAMPEDYGVIGFNRENLPIIPDNFKLIVRKVRDGKSYKNDAGAEKQIKIIDKLFKECDSIIVATDAGREGELIFRYIYDYLGCNKPFKRLWISSLTNIAIASGLQNLKDGAEYNDLYEAARSRSEADWLVGINATQALTISAGGGVFSLGRVQTPTLAMICDRYKENKEFQPSIYYKANIDINGVKATSTTQYKMRHDAEQACRELQNIGSLRVVSVEQKEKSENAPLLFDLTSLQKEANKRYGYTAQQTLDVAQKLYERKYITYPRTGSRYISEDVLTSLTQDLTIFSDYDGFATKVMYVRRNGFNYQSVNESKVTDHHAIIPTEVKVYDLLEDEQNIFDLILNRTLEALMPKCVKQITTVTFERDYNISTTKITSFGWRMIYGETTDEDEIDNLCIFNEGESYSISSTEVMQKQTQPKAIHTDSSLLSSMENAGRNLEDDAEREAIKDMGLGTPATRAATIEILLARGYIVRDGKSLVPTSKGLGVYDAVKDMRIANVQLTGEWENGLCRIERGELDSETFGNVSREYTRQIIDELFAKQVVVTSGSNLCCPKCGEKSISIFDKIAKCKNDECNFIVFRDIAGKRLSEKQVEELITNGKTALIKGFKSNAGVSFDAVLLLDDSHRTTFQFPKRKKSDKRGSQKLK